MPSFDEPQTDKFAPTFISTICRIANLRPDQKEKVGLICMDALACYDCSGPFIAWAILDGQCVIDDTSNELTKETVMYLWRKLFESSGWYKDLSLTVMLLLYDWATKREEVPEGHCTLWWNLIEEKSSGLACVKRLEITEMATKRPEEKRENFIRLLRRTLAGIEIPKECESALNLLDLTKKNKLEMDDDEILALAKALYLLVRCESKAVVE